MTLLEKRSGRLISFYQAKNLSISISATSVAAHGVVYQEKGREGHRVGQLITEQQKTDFENDES